MTEQNVSARERFKHRANEYMDAEYHRDDEDIDEMLKIIREALLSEPAVDAANKLLPDYSQDTNAHDVISAAWDTVFFVEGGIKQ